MRLLYILVFVLPVCVQGEQWNMITIRDLYYTASSSKEDSEKFKSAVKSIPTPNECIKGYVAVSYMIEAKHVFNPATKLSYFNKGKILLDNSIKIEPQNTELRFLRLGIQTNVPSFLEYNKQIEADKNFILLKYLSQTDLDLKKRIKEFMIQSDICSQQEKKIFN